MCLGGMLVLIHNSLNIIRYVNIGKQVLPKVLCSDVAPYLVLGNIRGIYDEIIIMYTE